ncbi:hypothetical protein JVU11DRAFT_7710 [Chiua virens]|nr:hypothetical protein JVU11DRAFT_7710 [Chiua virens]
MDNLSQSCNIYTVGEVFVFVDPNDTHGLEPFYAPHWHMHLCLDYSRQPEIISTMVQKAGINSSFSQWDVQGQVIPPIFPEPNPDALFGNRPPQPPLTATQSHTSSLANMIANQAVAHTGGWRGATIQHGQIHGGSPPRTLSVVNLVLGGINWDATIEEHLANSTLQSQAEGSGSQAAEEDSVMENQKPEEDVESDELSPPPSPHKPRLKIKLKLPQILSPNESSSRGPSTPSGEPSRPPSHRGVSRGMHIESEDEDDEDEVVGGSTHPMTSRQAVLASVVDSSHVSLSESSRSKKKQLTESEIALRREETARKRKNLTEKKLEDEKVETINRLLKKQSKSKNKRNVLSTADDRTPVSATPAVVQSTLDGSEAPEGEVLEPVEIVPTMYRWVSSTKPISGNAEPASRDDKDGRLRLTFSVPVSILPHGGVPTPQATLPPAEKPVCDVSGCNRARKYRLVKDWLKGACGMEHLKMLEHQMEVDVV